MRRWSELAFLNAVPAKTACSVSGTGRKFVRNRRALSQSPMASKPAMVADMPMICTWREPSHCMDSVKKRTLFMQHECGWQPMPYRHWIQTAWMQTGICCDKGEYSNLGAAFTFSGDCPSNRQYHSTRLDVSAGRRE